MEIKNLTKAATRIKKAIKNKEPIILYGDSDMDGVSAIIILQEAILSLGGKIASLYFPNRENDGYGITQKALNDLKKFAPALFVAMDLGISNFKEIIEARKIGFDVIIVDHHEILDRLPKANIIVDPKQPSDPYPFKGLAACGVTFKLAEKLLGKNYSASLRKSLVELAVLGTIADMMPREEDNISIIADGLEAIEDSWRPGIQAFFELEEIKKLPNINTKVDKIIAVLNVRDEKDGFPGSFQVLMADSKKKAVELVIGFMEKNKLRRERTQELAEQVRGKVANEDTSAVFEGGKSFEYMLLPAVASIISNEYKKPSFIYTQKEKESLGSVRAPAGYNTVEAMKECGKLAITYGGHAQASGFRVKNENIEEFKKCIVKHFENI